MNDFDKEIAQESFDQKRLNVWSILFLRWHGLVLSFTSILYGSWLVAHPYILNTYKSYEIINLMFSNRVIPWFFIALGVLKILGIAINSKTVRLFAIFAMAFLWMVFGFAFMLVDMQNTIWIFSFSLALQCFGVAFKEV